MSKEQLATAAIEMAADKPLSGPLFEVGLPLALAIIMLGMGLGLKMADFRRVVEQPRAVGVGTIGQLLFIPLLAFAVAFTVKDPMIAVGIVLIGALPGGTTSNVMTHLARGNLALSITLTVIASLAIIATLPFYINYSLDLFQDGSLQIEKMPVKETLTMVAGIVIIPIGLGMFFGNTKPQLAARAEKIINIVAALILIGLVIAITVVERERLPMWIEKSWHAILLLNVASVAVAYLTCKISGLNGRDLIAVMVELSLKNTTFGMIIAIDILKTPALAVPAAAYSLLMYFTAGILILIGRKMDRKAAS